MKLSKSQTFLLLAVLVLVISLLLTESVQRLKWLGYGFSFGCLVLGLLYMTDDR